MKKIVQFSCIVLLLPFLLTITACQQGNKSVETLDSEEYKKLIAEIDRIAADFGAGGIEDIGMPIAEEFRKADAEKKAELALDLADDMAQAQFFGIVNNDMLALSGEAVKAYPHPLLLNNYGALLLDVGAPQDALYFFRKAADQDGENPVILTNIANIFLELEDFSAAESYAKDALAAAPDFGAAYQVLTTVYMQKEQYKLAAEYLLMSAKHCFNDISEYQFESFLDAVTQLNPEEDDYPVDEQQIEDFRKAAIENVDTMDIDDSVDTPSAQLKLKPFPQVGSPDNLMRSFEYFHEEREKSQQKYSEINHKIMELSNETYDASNSSGTPGVLVYPVEKNLRQIYALEVLQSYYEFKLEQCKRRYLKSIRKAEQKRDDDIKLIENKYEEVRKTMADDNLTRDKLLSELFSIFDTKRLPEINKYTAAMVAGQKTVVDECTEILKRSKDCSSEIVNILEEYYREAGQMLEEFWLKAGGLLKCFADEDTFRLYDLKRQQVVCSYAGVPASELENQAYGLERREFDRRIEEMTLMSLIAADKEAEKADEAAKAAFVGNDTVPDMEDEAISIYKEKNDLGAIGAEVETFGLSGSVSYDGEADAVNLSGSAPFGSISREYNLSNGSKDAYTVHGVVARADTGWFKNTKAVQDALGASGKAGKALGTIGFGFSRSNMNGQYAQKGSNGHITDRGVIRIRESTGSIGPISKTERVEVRKSLITGVAIKKTSTKYKFMFLTYQK